MDCAHAGDPAHQCCGKHEGHAGRVTAVSAMLEIPGTLRGPTERRMEMAKDPICGMDVEAKRGAIQSTYQGKTYYFCGDGCKRTFDADPGAFAKA